MEETQEQLRARIEEALKHIDVETTDNQTWVKIGTALKTAGMPFEMFDQWSSKDTRFHEYQGTDKTLKRWESFRVGAVNVGSIFHVAGYMPSALETNNTSCKATLQQKSDYVPADGAHIQDKEFIKQCENELVSKNNEPVLKYLFQRGIDLKTLKQCHIGAYGNNIVFPYDNGCYCMRDITKGTTDKTKYINEKGMKRGLFNSAVLFEETETPVFVCEGQLDCMNIIREGYKALSTCSTGGVNQLIEFLEALQEIPTLILCFDNDEAGIKATNKFKSYAKTKKIKMDLMEIKKPYNDINEWYMKDSESLKNTLSDKYDNNRSLTEDEEKIYYIEQESNISVVRELFEDSPENLKPPVSTGFKALDQAIEGGLYGEMYTIGAGTGEGKTAFCLQMADNIAKNGNDVLIVSLEMSKKELVARSISRGTYNISQSIYKNSSKAKTEQGISSRIRYKKYSAEELEIIERAKSNYLQYAQYVHIIEGVGDLGVTQIREAVERHIRLTGKKPVVLVDYLQIIAPSDIRATDKQNTDKNVLELKRIARDNGTPILLISSLNRESYKLKDGKKQGISMASFKESGIIEYTSTVVIGLEVEEYNEEDETKIIQLTLLKNRKGKKGTKILYKYVPKYQSYSELGAKELEQEHAYSKAKVM